MLLNIANPATGLQKIITVEDERKLNVFYEKRMSQELSADFLGDEWKGYVLKITGGNDKEGFPMKQGILVPHRVKIMMRRGQSCYRERRSGERKRKSVRGCIVGPDLVILNAVIVKKGEKELPGLTDSIVPRRLAPKRASKIRKMFGLTKEEDVKKFVVRREVANKKEGKKSRWRAPRIQRLITPKRALRKRHYVAEKISSAIKSHRDEKFYRALVTKRMNEVRRKKAEKSKVETKEN